MHQRAQLATESTPDRRTHRDDCEVDSGRVRFEISIAFFLASTAALSAEQVAPTCVGAGGVIAAETLVVATLNVSHGRNTAINQMFVSKERTHENLDRIATMLDRSGADVVALQEVDASSRWSGNFDHLKYLVANTSYEHSVHGRHARSWMYSYGTAILSRCLLHDARVVDFAPSPPTTTKGFTQATIYWLSGAGPIPVTLVSVHLDYSRKKVRDEQVAAMIAALSDLDSEVIILGDINSQWSDKQPHVKELAEGLGLTAFDPEMSGLGTYKSADGKRLDWILISSGLEFANYEVLPDIVADHLPVIAEIRHRGE